MLRLVAGITVIIASVASAQAQSLEEQGICAKQAKIAFDDYNADSNKLSNSIRITGDYESHYNTKLNKCLIAIETTYRTGTEFLTTALLMDAFERRVYANYGWVSHPDKKYWEVPPITCDLIPTSQTQSHCSSKQMTDWSQQAIE
jgi:hypothetical protein